MVKNPLQAFHSIQNYDIDVFSIVRRSLAVFLAVLLCSSGFAAGGVTFQSSSGPEMAIEATSSTTDYDSSKTLTAYEQRQAAIDEIRSIDSGLSREERASLTSTLNASFEDYSDEDRVRTRRVFENDTVVLDQLRRRVNGSDIEESEELRSVDEASYRLVNASERSTAVAVEDAERAIAIAENRSLDEDAILEARAEVEAAKTLYTGGLTDDDRCCESSELLDNRSRLVDELSARESRIDELGDAYGHTRTALRILNEAGISRLYITSRPDPDDQENLTIPVQGDVLVTHPDEVDVVHIEVNENTSFRRPVRQPDEPLRNASFSFRVNLTEPVNEIEVTANSTLGEESNESDVPVAYDSLKMDGDGLPDEYEEEVTNTDPLDPDSNSNRTTTDESNNGVTDDEEDFDGDSITTMEEFRFGTDPLSADSDEDGLNDSYELQITGTSPTNPDSNTNGISDGAEDQDGDGLPNVQEADIGTDPNLADSDSDGLNDGNEIVEDTDPFDDDTDDDFLKDGTEVQSPFNTNPNDPDTDGDGVLDGNETYTTSASDVSRGVEVDVTGEGNVAEGVTIENGDRAVFDTAAINSASVTDIVELESRTEFDTAEITFSYDEEEVDGDEANLTLARYNETYQTFLPIESTVNPLSDTITAETPHFSRYVVMNGSAWHANFQEVNRPGEYFRGYDVAFIADTSGSMSGSPADLRDASAKHYVGSLKEHDRAAVVDFDGSAVTREHLTSDFDSVNSTIDGLGAGGGTDIAAGIDEALNEFDRNSKSSQNKTGVLLSDGVSDSAAAKDAARRAADRGVRIHTIGMGSADNTTLQEIASITNGTFAYVSDTSQLPKLFFDISANDTDEDGIPDQLERDGMRVGFGQIITTDPNRNDTDGDGLKDGEEIIVDDFVHTPLGWFYLMESNPLQEDTDRDGLTDDVEVNGWNVSVVNKSGTDVPNPYRYDHRDEQDNEVRFFSNPHLEDSDGDGITDFAEKNYLRTNPEERITYGVTVHHQRHLIDDVYESWNQGGRREKAKLSISLRSVGIIGDDESAEKLEEVRLDDGTDDSEFVYLQSKTDDQEEILDRFTFKSPTAEYKLSGDLQQFHKWIGRTDTWLSNEAEVAAMSSESADVWDPDTDDDGLTDGQETRWITRETSIRRLGTVVQKEEGISYETSPTDPDTDGDGYWDGWIGVYNASNSENVVLYLENLNEQNITGDLEVNEQAGIHEVADNSNTGSDYYGNGRYHSNLHIGELKWKTDPRDDSSAETPSPSISLEVDFYEGAPSSGIRSQSWKEGIEANYALYGIDVDIVFDDTITDQDFEDECGYIRCVDPSDGFGYFDIYFANHQFGDRDTDEYLLIADEGQGQLAGNFGVNLLMMSEQAIFTESISTSSLTSYVSSDTLENSSYDTRVGFLAAGTEIHEIGHSFGAGEADDDLTKSKKHFRRWGEIYSGYDDPTVEEIYETSKWSIMSRSNTNTWERPMYGHYYAYSIEEAATIRE